jgi:eukaryotic-like serine/threonine-protein kinase
MMESTPQPGKVLGGKYTVLRLLGEGGMGAVFEAEHTLSRKRVAIKWMHAHLAANADAAPRMVREAQASALVRHPNVVDVYDVVQDGDAIFLVMEFLEGETLAAYLEREPRSIAEVIALLLPAMRGVDAAHAQGVIHRDIKPDNIFLARVADTPRPVPKVLDFGISKITGGDQTSMTRTGTSMGTPLYMSYEQICGEKNIDARTDIYAFGVILYEVATGQPPFQATSFPELVMRIATSEPVAPKRLRPDLPAALDRAILRAMAKQRDGRFKTLKQLIVELEAFASEQAFRPQASRVARAAEPARIDRREHEATPDTLEPQTFISHSPSEVEILRVKRHVWPPIAVGLGLFLGIGMFVWWTISLTQAPPGQAAGPAIMQPLPAPAAEVEADLPSEAPVDTVVETPKPAPIVQPTVAPAKKQTTDIRAATSPRPQTPAPQAPVTLPRAAPPIAPKAEPAAPAIKPVVPAPTSAPAPAKPNNDKVRSELGF